MIVVNYYEVLDVDPKADSETIKTAIRKQRREWRNRTAHPKAETRALAERMTQHISDAEGVLLDAANRSNYDHQLAAQIESRSADLVESSSRDWVAVIREYLANGNPTSANYAARRATSEQPNLAEAWYLQGVSSDLLGNLADAEFEYGEAIRLDPNNAAYHAELADLYTGAGHFGRAQQSYQRANDLEPDNLYYRVGVAAMQTAQGRCDLALPILEQAVEQSPETEYFRHNLAVALTDDIVTKCSRFGDGSSAILNGAQLQFTQKTLSRLHGLKVSDPDLNHHIAEISRLAADAERVQWEHPDNVAAYVIGFLVSLGALFAIGVAPWIGIVGLVGVIAIPFIYVKLFRGPGYVHSARNATDFVRKTGLQPLAGQP
ncbi:MAG: tetratricopeptide repeat protein [Thermomicrobiales bacterium]